MAKVDMVMPKMGESIMEGTILKWHKKVGDKVQKDENILDIATDKVDAEVPAVEAGILAEILFKEGDEVPVGEVIARIETDASAAVATPTEPSPAKPVEAKVESKKSEIKEEPVAEIVAATPPVSGNGEQEVAKESAEKGRFYSPVVMKIAQEEGIGMAELERIEGTGTGGRLTKSDVLGYMKNRSQAPISAPKAAPALSAPVAAPEYAPAAPHIPISYDPARSEVIKMDNMRKLIAEHMVRSKHTSAHVTSVSEADVTGLVRLVKAKKDAFEKLNGLKLTFTPFFIDATIKSLKKYPMVNVSVDGDKIILKKYINFGVAVSLGDSGESGLIVPVIKNADEMNLVGIARSVNDLATRARVKKLLPDEIQGGTFTLTNYGTTGNIFGSPIINQPQVAILGTGAIVKRPVVRTLEDGSDAIVIRSIMYLSLSYDHRIIDGALAGVFLQSLVKTLESYDENTPV